MPLEGYEDGQGRICRDYRTTATIEGRQQEIYGTACRQPDGSWQRVRLGAPAVVTRKRTV